MRAFRLAAGVTGLIAVLTVGVGTASARSSGWVATHTQSLTQIMSASTTTELGPLAGSTPMRIDVVMPVRRASALADRAQAEANPASKDYERYLTPSQFATEYAPTQATVSAVTGYLTSQGFTHVSVDSNQLMVTADGSAAQVEQAFDTTLDQFAVLGDTAHPVYANTTAASVPSSLSGDVASVLGLNDFYLSDQPQVETPQLPLTGYYPKQFQTVYDATGTPTGGNTTIAVMAEGDLTGVISDLRYAEKQQKLPRVPLTVVRTGPATSDTSGADEWDLDTQVSTGMAQTVKELYLYDMPTLTDADLAHAINVWASQDVAREGSASLGEPDILPYLDGSMLAIDTSVEESAVQGQTFFASTGDTGASCAVEDTNGVPDSGIPASLCYPADGTWTTAVGGTTLITDTNDNYEDELAWNAGGGGISELEYPGPWTDNANPASEAGARGDPDIAMDADLTTGCLVYVDKTLELVGGTSVSSPLAMGSYSRVQSAHNNTLGDGVLQFYRLYNAANPSAPRTNPTPGFHDIIAGSNGGYTAAPGWDYTTGIGSIDVAALIKAI
jgi:subtilase family serine protease